MSVFTPIRINKNTKVHSSEYIRTENKPNDTEAKPAEPLIPVEPKAK
jgi:hypothetical protein